MSSLTPVMSHVTSSLTIGEVREQQKRLNYSANRIWRVLEMSSDDELESLEITARVVKPYM